ncbi:MAG: hypothetical protein FJX74_12375 [Armatimonadetes bacterium]|nr:hypothetical protein [Armatimonadota bacterium]
MRPTLILLSMVIVVGALTGCPSTETRDAAPPTSVAAPATPAEPPAATGAPLGSIKVGDQAVCSVCAAEGGEHGLEEVKATLDYKGQTYAFCSEAEKAQFISEHTGGADAGN